MKKITVITPCYNEEENILNCVNALQNIMIKKLSNYDYEHIICDNFSTDSTRKVLREIAQNNKNVKVIFNSRNIGPFKNIWNALKKSSGDAVIPFLPADLQDPPEVIPKFIDAWEQGYSVVYGIRMNRKDPYILKIFRKFYYFLIKNFSQIEIPPNAGEFLLADRRTIDSIIQVDDEYPYVRGLIAQTSPKYFTISYQWRKRIKGKSKNSFFDLVDQAINGFVTTSRVPARIASITGLIVAFAAIIFAFITVTVVLFSHREFSPGTPTIIVTILLFGGINLFFLGILGEYILSIHGQVRKIPPMFEEEVINF